MKGDPDLQVDGQRVESKHRPGQRRRLIELMVTLGHGSSQLGLQQERRGAISAAPASSLSALAPVAATGVCRPWLWQFTARALLLP
jgi:hypothetical protein